MQATCLMGEGRYCPYCDKEVLDSETHTHEGTIGVNFTRVHAECAVQAIIREVGNFSEVE